MKWTKNMEPIDFSPLHDYLLKDDDGNILQMDVPHLRRSRQYLGE